MTEDERVMERYLALKQTLSSAAAKWGGISILPVTKTVPAERILALKGAGVEAIGENRVQEAMGKLEALNGAFAVHMIGRLQTNKARQVAKFAAMAQSLDRLELAEALDNALKREGRELDALIEVNIAGDPAKAGVSEADAPDFLRALKNYPRLRVRGLMTIAPLTPDAELVRPYFRKMRALFERLRNTAPGGRSMDILSMGMSSDCVVAAEEGATLVRVGSAIFGERA